MIDTHFIFYVLKHIYLLEGLEIAKAKKLFCSSELLFILT